MLSNELNFIFPEKKTEDDALNGKTFCITGSLTHFNNREAMIAEIYKHGGKFVSGVTSQCQYLINNNVESQSSKNKKAKALGVEIITEEDFIKMLGE